MKKQSGNKPIHILMVENDPIDAELSTLAFRRAGVDVRSDVVQSPEEFRQKIEEREYDVILADYNLGGWTGLHAFEYLRSRGRKTPFILVTGAVGDEVAVECIKRGIADYVLKDRLARLPLAVEKVLEEKALREERIRAEKLASEKERRFLSLMEHSADGIVLLNEEGRVIFTNGTESRILGYTTEELTGRKFFEPVDPRDVHLVSRAFEWIHCGLSGHERLQLRYQQRSGSWRWLECILVNLLEEPAVKGIVVNYRDISERKEAEEEIRKLNEELELRVEERTLQLEEMNLDLQEQIKEKERAESVLRESQERFRLLVDGVRDYAVYMLDSQGRIASWNVGAERLTGYAAEEIIGRHVSCFYSREGVEQGLPEQDLRAVMTQGRAEGERLAVRKDGSKFWVHVVLSALRDPSGRLQGFSKVARDITEPKRVHEALERLRLQQQHILNSAGDGIIGLDESGACTFINPAGARMIGREPEELTGKALYDLLLCHTSEGEIRRDQDCPIRIALENGTMSHSANAMLTREDGTTLAIEYIVTPILNESRRILGAVMVFRDVTARRAVETMKDEFISVVSHEVRTPLTAIRAALGLLASGKLCPLFEKCQAMVKVGLENTDRLSRLVNDILDLERIESRRASMEKKRCDTQTLIAKAVELMQMTAESNGISILTDVRSIPLWADSDRILQVLINLLSNSIKFSPKGSTVSVGVGREDGNVVFNVKDMGRGIPPDKITQIFERFKQVDAGDSREKGGTGLGLAICRSIVTQHGGRIWVESAPGQGSTFFFTLPDQEMAA